MRYVVCLGLGLLGGFVGAYLFDLQRVSPALTILSTPEQDALNLPFAEGVQLGDVIYLSGQLGVRPGTLDVVPGGIGPTNAANPGEYSGLSATLWVRYGPGAQMYSFHGGYG